MPCVGRVALSAVRRFLVLSAGFLLVTNLTAATRNWTGTTSGTWSVGSNWGGTAPSPSDDLVFNATANANALNNDYPASTPFNSLTFSGAATYSPGGNTILLGAGGVTVTGGASWNNFIPITLGASQIWTLNAPGANGFGGPTTLDLGSNTLTITGNGTINIPSTIMGSGGITLTGTGTTTLQGTLNYTGVTNVNSAAHLALTSLGTVNTPIAINSGGFLDIPAANSVLTAANVGINAGGTFDLIVNGASVGQYSRLTSNKNITLAGNLVLTNNVIHPVGTVISFLGTQLGGTISGTFNGLPDGSPISSGGQTFIIHYTSTSVTLTAQAAATSDLTITKTHTGNFVAGQTGATFTITVTNSGTGPTSGVVTVADTLPAGLTATGFSGTGWACTLTPLQCTRNDALAASSSYPPLTLTVNVASNATSPQTNTATVSGGGEGNTANDTATDAATITTPVPSLSLGVLMMLGVVLAMVALRRT